MLIGRAKAALCGDASSSGFKAEGDFLSLETANFTVTAEHAWAESEGCTVTGLKNVGKVLECFRDTLLAAFGGTPEAAERRAGTHAPTALGSSSPSPTDYSVRSSASALFLLVTPCFENHRMLGESAATLSGLDGTSRVHVHFVPGWLDSPAVWASSDRENDGATIVCCSSEHAEASSPRPVPRQASRLKLPCRAPYIRLAVNPVFCECRHTRSRPCSVQKRDLISLLRLCSWTFASAPLRPRLVSRASCRR